MIGYVTLGTNQLQQAAGFYDALFESIGAGRVLEGESFIAWGRSMQEPSISLIRPYDGQPATVGNGVMVAIALDSPERVDQFHARALALGGTDEGAPGPREGGFYVGYFRDLDGNKLNGFCLVEDAG